MSSSGAYEGEMASEHTPGGADVAAFLNEMRAAYVAEPDEAVASGHLAAMARGGLRQMSSWPMTVRSLRKASLRLKGRSMSRA